MITLTPAKAEFRLRPGETIATSLKVSNDSSDSLNFTVTVEDFVSIGLGPEELPSLENYLVPTIRNFSLSPDTGQTIPLAINLSTDTAPGGLYGVVLVTASGGNGGGTQIASRLGSLFFVRVEGAVTEAGELVNFDWRQDNFYFNFHNSGNIYLNPYGLIKIENIFTNETVGSLVVDPWFVLPATTRERELAWSASENWGFYRATLSLNRGYADRVDEATTIIITVPLAVLVGLGLVSLVLATLLARLVIKWVRK